MNPSFLICCAAALISTGCVIDARRADTVIGPPRHIELPVPEDAVVDVRIPAGEVEIRGAGGNELRAELIVRCPDAQSRCARRLGAVQWVSEVEDGRVGLGLSHDRSFRYRQGNVQARIEVPRSRGLAVNMTAGELTVSGVDTCLSVDMGAGDVAIRAPAATVGRVSLDAGIGDAHLLVEGRAIEAPRSWLIGAEVSWDQGAGPCRLAVDLQAGDIDVSLD